MCVCVCCNMSSNICTRTDKHMFGLLFPTARFRCTDNLQLASPLNTAVAHCPAPLVAGIGCELCHDATRKNTSSPPLSWRRAGCGVWSAGAK